MKTVREYAEQEGLSYEVIRAKLTRYAEELGDHVITKGRTRYLDEYAQEFLKQHQRNTPVFILSKAEQELRQKVAALEQEVQELHAQIESLQGLLLEAQTSYIDALKANEKALQDNLLLSKQLCTALEAPKTPTYKHIALGFYRLESED